MWLSSSSLCNRLPEGSSRIWLSGFICFLGFFLQVPSLIRGGQAWKTVEHIGISSLNIVDTGSLNHQSQACSDFGISGLLEIQKTPWKKTRYSHTSWSVWISETKEKCFLYIYIDTYMCIYIYTHTYIFYIYIYMSNRQNYCNTNLVFDAPFLSEVA